MIELGTLTDDELREARELSVVIRAIEAAPTLFGRQEVLAAYRADLDLSSRIRRRLELGPERVEWDLTFGTVTLEGD